VVIYDDSGGLHASRLFFTLEVLGHEKAAILDGGIQAWRRAGLPLTREIPKVSPAIYRPTVRPERVASAEWVRDRLGDPTVALVDARTPAEYQGKDVRAKRGGHRASHTYFVLRLLGYPKVVGYDRSWVEWGNRDDFPVER
jgi:thiosulfate/3-mercaptopyruvate sulfurtransferase